jgi:hypothetical protein
MKPQLRFVRLMTLFILKSDGNLNFVALTSDVNVATVLGLPEAKRRN